MLLKRGPTVSIRYSRPTSSNIHYRAFTMPRDSKMVTNAGLCVSAPKYWCFAVGSLTRCFEGSGPRLHQICVEFLLAIKQDDLKPGAVCWPFLQGHHCLYRCIHRIRKLLASHAPFNHKVLHKRVNFHAFPAGLSLQNQAKPAAFRAHMHKYKYLYIDILYFFINVCIRLSAWRSRGETA